MVATILSQVEFYFSNANLRRDKFMRSKIGEDADGFVPIEVLLTFKRLQNLTSSAEEIAAAVVESSKLRLSEDKTKISRTTPFTDDDMNADVKAYTVFLNHIDQDSTIDSVTEMMSKYGSVEIVRIPKLRKQHAVRKIEGTAFVEFTSADTVAKVLEALPRPAVKPQGDEPRPLYALNMAQWEERKQEKRAARKNKGKPANQQAEVLVRGNLVRLTGLSPEVKKHDLVTLLKTIKDVKYVDLKPESTTAITRYASAEEASAVVAHLAETEVLICNERISGEIVGSEEEQEYWNNVMASKGRASQTKRKRPMPESKSTKKAKTTGDKAGEGVDVAADSKAEGEGEPNKEQENAETAVESAA